MINTGILRIKTWEYMIVSTTTKIFFVNKILEFSELTDRDTYVLYKIHT